MVCRWVDGLVSVWVVFLEGHGVVVHSQVLFRRGIKPPLEKKVRENSSGV